MAVVRERRERGLRSKEKVALALLALTTFALALSITMVSSYLGEVTGRFTQDTIVIGVIIGSEGVMALVGAAARGRLVRPRAHPQAMRIVCAHPAGHADCVCGGGAIEPAAGAPGASGERGPARAEPPVTRPLPARAYCASS